ncbi:hypothetical protein CRENBAI_013441 [Crenichthys baileyi]|uniref:Uncharacterized protein n=1 Tax=Crenichthys baileyi TaxID=28760 RepID=A0AAV9RMC5_9TELE
MRRPSIPRSTPPQTPWGRESVRMDRERPRTATPLLYIPRSQSMSPVRENIQNLTRLSIDSAPPLPSDWETTRSQPMRSSWPAAVQVSLAQTLCTVYQPLFTCDQVFLYR